MNDYINKTMNQNVFLFWYLTWRAGPTKFLLILRTTRWIHLIPKWVTVVREKTIWSSIYAAGIRSNTIPSRRKVNSGQENETKTRPQIEEDRLILLDRLSTSLCWLDGGSPAVSGCCFLMHLEHNHHYVSCCHFQTVCCQPPSATPGNTNREIRLVCCLPVVHCILCVFVI